MARGALAATGASSAISTTGIAGPGGGSAEKPVGLVYLHCAAPSASSGGASCSPEIAAAVRDAASTAALHLALSLLR